jgi:hypothetical protein
MPMILTGPDNPEVFKGESARDGSVMVKVTLYLDQDAGFRSTDLPKGLLL